MKDVPLVQALSLAPTEKTENIVVSQEGSVTIVGTLRLKRSRRSELGSQQWPVVPYESRYPFAPTVDGSRQRTHRLQETSVRGETTSEYSFH